LHRLISQQPTASKLVLDFLLKNRHSSSSSSSERERHTHLSEHYSGVRQSTQQNSDPRRKERATIPLTPRRLEIGSIFVPSKFAPSPIRKKSPNRNLRSSESLVFPFQSPSSRPSSSQRKGSQAHPPATPSLHTDGGECAQHHIAASGRVASARVQPERNGVLASGLRTIFTFLKRCLRKERESRGQSSRIEG
jgi:hypothetical protein